MKDILSNVFYRGAIRYRGEEFAGAHEALIDDDLFRRVQARRGAPRARGPEVGNRGVLQGRVYCWHSGLPLQCDRDKRGRPTYRERYPCRAAKRSLRASGIDEQIGAIWQSLPFPAAWRRRMAEILAAEHDFLTLEALFRNARRITGSRHDRVDDERGYALLLATIGERAPELVPSARVGPSRSEAAELFSDMPALWDRAANEERRRLIAPLIQHVYVDLDAERIRSAMPTPDFNPAHDGTEMEWPDGWWDR